MAKRARAETNISAPPAKRTRTAVSSKPVFNGLEEAGLSPHLVSNDGACFFRAIAHQLSGSEASHSLVRRKTVEWMATHREDFEPFYAVEARPTRQARIKACAPVIAAPARQFDGYLKKMRGPSEWATALEVTAVAAALGLKVVVHRSDASTTIVPEAGSNALLREVHVCFHVEAQHYWSTDGKPLPQSAVMNVASTETVASDYPSPENSEDITSDQSTARLSSPLCQATIKKSCSRIAQVADEAWADKIGFDFDADSG